MADSASPRKRMENNTPLYLLLPLHAVMSSMSKKPTMSNSLRGGRLGGVFIIVYLN